MNKDVSFSGRPPSKDNQRAAEAFASISEDAPPVEKVTTKRLTANVPADLHSQLKLYCVRNDVTIADVVCEMLLERFSRNQDIHQI